MWSTDMDRTVRCTLSYYDGYTYKIGKELPPQCKSANMISMTPYLSLIQPAACSVCWQKNTQLSQSHYFLGSTQEDSHLWQISKLKRLYSRAGTSVIILQTGGRGALTFLYSFPITGIHPISLHKWAELLLLPENSLALYNFLKVSVINVT